jgi:hypothetical protein
LCILNGSSFTPLISGSKSAIARIVVDFPVPRSKWYKGKAASEVGAAATDASRRVEFALTAHKKFSIPETTELLNGIAQR